MDGCIEHNQKSTEKGYAMTTWCGRQARLHRVVYCKAHGLTLEDIDGLVVMHRCDNPRCINPEHLQLGTQSDNVQDMLQKGRCRAAHGEAQACAKLTEAQVLEIRRRYAAGGVSQRALAKEYGVAQSNISRCINGGQWQHAG